MKLISMLRGHGSPPDDVVIVERQHTLTRRQLGTEVSRAMTFLRANGVQRGDRVLAIVGHDSRGVALLAAASGLDLHVLMPYNLESAALAEWLDIAASARPHHIVVGKPVGPALSSLEQTGISVIVLADPNTEQTSAPAVDVAEIDSETPVESFLVLFTSGTTGAPKAISVSETAVCQRIVSVTEKLSFSPDARVFMSGLINNTTGVIFSFGALHHAATLIFPEQRDVPLWPGQVAHYAATHIMLRPRAMRQFVRSLESNLVDVRSLRVVAYGAAATPRDLLEEARRLIPCQWVQGYGLSETFGPFCWLDEHGHRQGRYRRTGHCVGTPDETVDVRLEPLEGHAPTTGEVSVRSTAMMDGYYEVATNRLDPAAEWLRTGDVGEWSNDGDLVLKGRLQASILSENGHQIYPEEVEAALGALPEVDEVALVGLPAGEHLAELPVACLSGSLATRRPDAIRRTVENALTGALSAEKWPELIYASTTPFQRNCGDKIMRSELVRRLDPAALIPVGDGQRSVAYR